MGWLRRQALCLAQSGCGPVSYWLEIPLTELIEWIKAGNALAEERRETFGKRRSKQ